MSEQFGIKEVYNCVISDYATRKPFLFVDYAESQTNENSAERTDIRGGQGGFKLLSFDSQKDSMLQMTLPLVDLKTLAMVGGEDLVEGAADVYKREELIVQEDTGTAGGMYVTLSQQPVNGEVSVFALEGERDFGEPQAVTVSGSQADLDGTATVVAGDKVVAFYQYSTPNTSKTIKIKANKFPKTVFITGEGLWRDQVDSLDKPVAMTAYKARPQANFTLTNSYSDATSLEITFDLYGEKTANGDYEYIDYTLIGDETP